MENIIPKKRGKSKKAIKTDEIEPPVEKQVTVFLLENTEPPVENTEPPVENTEPSVEKTEPPVEKQVTVSLLENTEPPVNTVIKNKDRNVKNTVSNTENKTQPVEIVLDERERDLYEEIMKIPTNIPISKRVLSIGDVIIKGEEDKDLLIIERKTLQDLLASIKDGRYSEQSFRLLNSSQLPPHQILYCIEGMISSVKSPEEKKRIYSAITSIHYYKGMSVLRTWSVQETAELLIRTAEKICKETANGKLPYNPVVTSENIENKEYSHNLTSSVKCENITPDNIGEIMLSQIPSVSVASAKALLAVYKGDFIMFMDAVKNDEPLLKQVYFGGEKRRKISGKCLENIRRLLLPKL